MRSKSRTVIETSQSSTSVNTGLPKPDDPVEGYEPDESTDDEDREENGEALTPAKVQR